MATPTKHHQPFEAIHEADVEWETLRWPGEQSKMIFHPRPERPTEPNAGFVKYEPGAGHPLHNHDFAQVWYIVEGEFKIGEKTYGPGTMIYHPDPHYEDEMTTETGGTMVVVQYQGPTTGGPPIYDKRFNVAERKPVDQDLDDQNRTDW